MERVCRVCLAEDRKTYRVVNTALEQTYDVVTSVKLQRADRPTALCCVCVSQLRRCRRFIETARESNDALDRWYNTYTDWKLMERPLFIFTKTPTECIDFREPQLKQEQSTETDDESQNVAETFITIDIKHEVNCNDVQSDPIEVSFEANDNTQTSDDEQDNKQKSCEKNKKAKKLSSVKKAISDVLKHDVKSENAPSKSKVKTNSTMLHQDIASKSLKSRKRIKVDQDITGGKANIKNNGRTTIVELHKEGLNISQIADATGFSRETVRRWVKRYNEEGSLETRVRSGRPPRLDHSQRRFMLTEYKQNGYVKPKDFVEVFDTSISTVRRALNSEGLHRRQFLLQRHSDERLRFARNYLDFNWETTVFCDEKTFTLSQQGGLRSCLKITNVNKQNTESGKIIVNVWGWMSAQGPGELVFMDTRPNSEQYLEILRDTMLPTVRTVYPEDDLSQINFVHDNNWYTSRSRSVQQWFSEQPNIRVIQWPPCSPDLNPIESLWDIMVQRWEGRNERSPEQVKAHCLQLWDSLRGTDMCQNIVASIRQRLQTCIDNKGGHIRY